MPLHLEPIDVIDDLAQSRAVLIVSCPVCPPVSLAMQRGAPWIELFKHGVKTEAFEHEIRALQDELGERGVRSDVYTMYVPSPMMCVWTRGQRSRLRRRAQHHDAVVVMGCESARVSVERALEGTGCRVVLAMELTGLTNALASFRLPLNVDLEENALVRDDGSVTDIDTAPSGAHQITEEGSS